MMCIIVFQPRVLAVTLPVTAWVVRSHLSACRVPLRTRLTTVKSGDIQVSKLNAVNCQCLGFSPQLTVRQILVGACRCVAQVSQEI